MCAQMKLYKVEILVASCLRLISQLMFLHEENGEGYLVATCSLEATASLNVATSFFLVNGLFSYFVTFLKIHYFARVRHLTQFEPLHVKEQSTDNLCAV